MTLTERESRILERLVEDYIETAKPISSQYLVKRHHLDYSPATVRGELLKLTDEGFLVQPHISAGRIPAQRGYRYFVDQAMNGGEEKDMVFEELRGIEEHLQNLVADLARATGLAAYGFSLKEGKSFTAGLKSLFTQPEFSTPYVVMKFGALIDAFNENLDQFLGHAENAEVLIGDEHPLLKESLGIVWDRNLLDRANVFVTVIGPMRMDYRRCIKVFKKLKDDL